MQVLSTLNNVEKAREENRNILQVRSRTVSCILLGDTVVWHGGSEGFNL
jgi:hypothetical protein